MTGVRLASLHSQSNTLCTVVVLVGDKYSFQCMISNQEKLNKLFFIDLLITVLALMLTIDTSMTDCFVPCMFACVF